MHSGKFVYNQEVASGSDNYITSLNFTKISIGVTDAARKGVTHIIIVDNYSQLLILDYQHSLLFTDRRNVILSFILPQI